jgi:hypothetical protein
MSRENAACRKFGRIAYVTGFVFIVAGITLYQLVLRDRIPPDFVAGGWFDMNGAIASGVAGGLSGLIGSLLGYGIERALSRPDRP